MRNDLKTKINLVIWSLFTVLNNEKEKLVLHKEIRANSLTFYH
jgi:hypothetical protein